ncbi:emp24/gp25L/p24 family/GOLD-domain-containing protein [Polychytrium aggregatum]|uniref:emp24/gp25L/p24 family/GOLD-domain-containing protein n=1 Tax=Polychytrium aggregatum TaxID=110093 RepID=UPI0022FEB37F|nr:emp24/gp25L/p24 family/GOLD-domain-containing protein [Polychytrium aggregatum]KAI9203709.1 emp24/gp25L/p24 family/GOLD-domain-containing protein [Polychytrium aggregatum]
MMMLRLWTTLALLVACVSAVKFELYAEPHGQEEQSRHCLGQYMGKDVLVVGSVDVGESPYAQQVNIEIIDTSDASNKYFSKRSASGIQKFSFTTHAYAEVKFCFTNVLEPGIHPGPQYKKTIQLHVDTGAEATDYSAMKENENLKPHELELKRLENMMNEMVGELDQLQSLEAQMRDINESTNDRVKWLSIVSLVFMFAVGGWQIWYLKKFFESKKLI